MANVRYTKEILQEVVSKVNRWSDACRLLGIKPCTGAQSHIKARVIHFGIDYSHFTKDSFTRGKPAINRTSSANYLVRGSTINSHKLKGKLFREGIKKKECEMCGVSEWLGEPVVLELDHIDSDIENNTLENLQILCPNCHALKTNRSRKERKEKSK